MINTILLILITINSFLGLVILLSIYGKAELLIDLKERQNQAFIDLLKGFLEGLKDFGKK